MQFGLLDELLLINLVRAFTRKRKKIENLFRKKNRYCVTIAYLPVLNSGLFTCRYSFRVVPRRPQFVYDVLFATLASNTFTTKARLNGHRHLVENSQRPIYICRKKMGSDVRRVGFIVYFLSLIPGRNNYFQLYLSIFIS